jgi:hypothetical protein
MTPSIKKKPHTSAYKFRVAMASLKGDKQFLSSVRSLVLLRVKFINGRRPYWSEASVFLNRAFVAFTC